jgi:hypothetical protein
MVGMDPAVVVFNGTPLCITALHEHAAGVQLSVLMDVMDPRDPPSHGIWIWSYPGSMDPG